MVRYALGIALLLGAAGAAAAGSWAEGLFDALSHDFGAVPRGPAVSHAFTVTNTTGAPLLMVAVGPR